MEPSLRITEIFYSLQGEAHQAGAPTVFVRLTGCPLRCVYCDSEDAFHGGQKLLFSEILDNIKQYSATNVCVTGGEPLAQQDVIWFLSRLCDEGYEVSLETSGALSIAEVDGRVTIVMDLKTPSSGEAGKNLYKNVSHLKKKDQVKFVIMNRDDYEWSRFKVDEFELAGQVGNVWFSSSFKELEPSSLAEWILEDGLPVRLQLQMHKLLWGEKPGV